MATHRDPGSDASTAETSPARGEKKELGEKTGQTESQKSVQNQDNYDDNDYDNDIPLADEASAGVQAVEMQRTHSQVSHVREPSPAPSRNPMIVPRSKRRGLFGQLALIPEVERPYEYADRTKWTITLIVALSAAGGPLGSSIFYPALSEMSRDLHASSTVTNLTIAMYMLSMSIFPLWWSSFSETLGRRTIYIISFSLFVVFSILSAISHSIGMLIVMRILGGGASASVQAVGAGTLADIWKPYQRGRAMGIFYLGPLVGPLLAPIIGGALAEHWGWQSTMWFLTIFGGLTLLMLFFCLPETLSRQHQQHNRQLLTSRSEHHQQPDDDAALGRVQSVRLRTQRAADFLRQALIDPLSVLLYLRFPPIALTVIYGAVTFGALFVLNVSIQSAFSSPPYGYGELVVGLLYIPGSVGYIVASLLGGRWIDNIMAREARKAGRYDADGALVYLPEDRMRENAWLSASLFPAAFVWFGWTVQHGVLWVVPCIATFLFGFGSMLVFGAVTTMLTEFMPRRSSGGIALNNFLRNIFSCTGAIVTQPLLNVMGFGWLSTAVALLAWLVGNTCIFLLRRYGSQWRVAMDKELNK